MLSKLFKRETEKNPFPRDCLREKERTRVIERKRERERGRTRGGERERECEREQMPARVYVDEREKDRKKERKRGRDCDPCERMLGGVKLQYDRTRRDARETALRDEYIPATL